MLLINLLIERLSTDDETPKPFAGEDMAYKTLGFFWVWICFGLLISQTSHARPLYEQDTKEMLNEALVLHNNTRGGAWIIATDPNERYEPLFSSHILKQLADRGDFDLLFNQVDEAFEVEVDRLHGMGQHPPPPKGLPFEPRPLHSGERGGLDGTSCRSCHFNGGPDGGGTGTSVALFRGDGERLSHSVQRDAPVLLGVGYIAILARDMSQALKRERERAIETAKRIQGRARLPLRVRGVSFGWISALPTGEVFTDEVEGVNKDLVIRPFGWKGRHHDLVDLADEALQLHHGLQTGSRVGLYRDQAEDYLGSGPLSDPDRDGVIQELYGGHPASLAAYMGLLAAPIYVAPTKLSESLDWAEGRRWFDEVGCATCHVPSLRLEPRALTIKSSGTYPIEIQVNPFLHGQEPRLRRLDYSPDAYGNIRQGIPLFLFSDLKRHRLGPALAEPRDEILPQGGVVAADEWLTRPLWGLADTAPYLHDGRAQTVEEAILAHGGEAEQVRKLYEALSPRERGQLHMFLMSLSREATLLVE